jgi:segregation and condensation protein B
MPDGVPVRQVVEAVLFATDSPLPAGKIAQILDRGTSRHVRRFIAELNEAYEREGRAFRIEEVAGGYQMLTVPALQPWLAKLLRARQESRLSPTQMETLAVIAYKQPVLRAAVEVVRGVACGDVINRLREMGLVKIVGRAEDVGRPLLYGTTKKFLRVFGLGSLEDLPRVEELRPPETAETTAAAPAPAAQPAEPPTVEQTEQRSEDTSEGTGGTA